MCGVDTGVDPTAVVFFAHRDQVVTQFMTDDDCAGGFT